MANEELRHLFERDQAARHGRPRLTHLLGLLWADRRRRQCLRQLIAQGALQTGADFYHAAMLLQHGLRLVDYWQAHLLAQRAVELGYAPARWLVAATLDRWLLRQGRPQKYGTQYVPAGAPRWAWWAGAFGVRRYRLWDVDPTTTDAERAAWGVPPLEIARAQSGTIGQPTRLGRTIARLAVGGLRVEVQDIAYLWSTAPPGAGREPPPEPLQAGDDPGIALPPAGLRLCRAGQGFGLLDTDGTCVATWRREHPPHDQPYSYYWRWQHPPQLDRVCLASHPAICIRGEPTGHTVILVQADHDTCWSISSRLPHPQLLTLISALCPPY